MKICIRVDSWWCCWGTSMIWKEISRWTKRWRTICWI